MEAPQAPVSAGTLADAFSEFIATSSRLEKSYRALQREVLHLNGELADRNAKLSATLAENIRMQQEREASRNAIALAQVSTMLAHEMRNPLASMELFADLIENDSIRRGEWITNLRAGIRTLSGTVNNVLSFHENVHPSPMKLIPLRLGDVIRQALTFMLPVAEQSDVALRFSPLPQSGVMLGNENALRQVLFNLIANAIRHTPAGGSIDFSLKCAGGWLELRCADNGTGIAEDMLDRIFEPGFTGQGEGVGLGLAVCERIVHCHNGRITAHNRDEGGACFVLEFPECRTTEEVA